MSQTEFEWDAAKSNACLRHRGFDFAFALLVFSDPQHMVIKDQRWDYGEDRFQVMGLIEDRVYVVIYTYRSSTVRIISARKANQREGLIYENNPRQS